MKNLFLYLIALTMGSGLMAQQVMHIDEYRPRHEVIDLSSDHFIKRYESTRLPESSLRSGAVSFVQLSQAANIYTILLDEQNQVAYNPDVNSVAFIHRTNPPVGLSGSMAFDRSIDGGATWNLDYLMTPNFQGGSAPVGGNRYPSVAIWNPAGNTNAANAFVIGNGPALQSGGAGWGWIFATSARLNDGSDNAENYYQQTPGVNTDFHPYGLTVNPNGDIWSVSTYFPQDGLTDYREYYLNKGTMNTSTYVVDWNVAEETIVPDYFLDTDGSNVGGYGWNIAFAPDGQTGYAAFLISENSSVYQGIQPIVHKTTDGGATWNRLPDFDFRTLTAFQDYLIPTSSGGPIPFFTSLDIAVDANDRLHMFSNVLPRSSVSNDSLFFIWVGQGTEGMFHLSTSTGADWTATLVDSILTTDGTVGTIGHPTRTQISSSPNGERIFFTWNATDANILTTHDLPNLRIRGYNVNTQEYTFIREPTAGTAVDGIIFFPVAAPIVSTAGSSRDYEIQVVFAQPGADDLNPPTFFYVRGAGFDEGDFGSLAPSAVADFSYTVVNSTVTFTNLSSEASSYIWDFGDGSALSNLTNPTKIYTAIGTYNVCLTARNSGTPATDDTECQSIDITSLTSGIQDQMLERAIVLFPSPSSGLVNLSVQGMNINEATVRVFNLLGEEVMAARQFPAGLNGTVQLDMSNLSNGHYLVKVETDIAVAARQITIAR